MAKIKENANLISTYPDCMNGKSISHFDLNARIVYVNDKLSEICYKYSMQFRTFKY